MRRSKSYLQEREQILLALLEQNSRMTVADICDQLLVSPATARRILTGMEERGSLVRVHGGVISAGEIVRKADLEYYRMTHLPEKRAIAREARRRIRDRDNLVLGGGTTCTELANLLMDLKNSVVITPCVNIANILIKNPNIEVRLPGGMMRPYTDYLVGPDTLAFFSSCFVQKAFLGADAISLKHGITTVNSLEADVDRAILRCANEFYVLADHTKLNRVSITKEYNLDVIECLIMDSGAAESDIAALRNMGVRTVLMDVE